MKTKDREKTGLSNGLRSRYAVPTARLGIAEKDRIKLGQGLASLLAETYVLYTKTQDFHWNVTGPLFYSLHLAFEAQYQDLAAASDLLAERIRTLGFAATATGAQFRRMGGVKESDETDAGDMVRELIEGNEAVVRAARRLCSQAAAAKDHGTADLVAKRIATHEKAAWMLRSLLN